MTDVVARYRAWLRLPVTSWAGGGLLAFFAGLTAVLMAAGGLVGGVVLDGYPGHGRLVGLALVAYGAVGLTLAYRVLRGRTLIREAVALALWWVPSRQVDTWVNDTGHGWRWPVVPLAVLVWLLAQGLRRHPPARPPEDAGDDARDDAGKDPGKDTGKDAEPAATA